MKRILTIALILVLMFSATACFPRRSFENAVKDALSDPGKDSNPPSDSGIFSDPDSSSDEGVRTKPGKTADDLISDSYLSLDYSLAAALNSLKNMGLELSDVEPAWEYTVSDDDATTSGDSENAVILFIKKNSLLSDAEYEAWLKKVFNTTAKLSDHRYNIEGYFWGDGEIEVTWDDFINSDDILTTWSYKYKGTIMDVQISGSKEKDSDYSIDESGRMSIIHFYNGVKLEVSIGLQKSWDDTFAEIGQILGDENMFKDALDNLQGNP